jgi:hypothetical protein
MSSLLRNGNTAPNSNDIANYAVARKHVGGRRVDCSAFSQSVLAIPCKRIFDRRRRHRRVYFSRAGIDREGIHPALQLLQVPNGDALYFGRREDGPIARETSFTLQRP